MAVNSKSDVEAKNAFRDELIQSKIFDKVEVTHSPADITAWKCGCAYYFEIKYTEQTGKYFGSASITEWQAAMKNKERFRFVVAARSNGQWTFREYTPEEFMKLSYIPPFKVYFIVPISASKEATLPRMISRVPLTPERIEQMSELYEQFRTGQP